MAISVLKVSINWEQKDGDCSPCSACNDPMFLKMNVLVVEVGELKEDTKWKLCDSCYNITEDE